MLDSKIMSWDALLDTLARVFGKRPCQMTVRRWQKRAENPFPRHRHGPGGTYFVTKEVESWFAKERALA